MITCRVCGHIHVECETKAKGVNLHTKIGSKNEVIVTPEFYRITDGGKPPKIACECKKLDLMFTCDYCGRPIEEEVFSLVEDRHGKRMVSCDRCVEDRPASSKIEEVEIGDFKFKAKN